MGSESTSWASFRPLRPPPVPSARSTISKPVHVFTLEPTVLWVVTGEHGSSSLVRVATGSSSLVLKTWGSLVMGGVKPA